MSGPTTAHTPWTLLRATLGCLAAGYEADVVALDVPEYVHEEAALLDAIAFRRDAGAVRATLVRGRVLR